MWRWIYAHHLCFGDINIETHLFGHTVSTVHFLLHMSAVICGENRQVIIKIMDSIVMPRELLQFCRLPFFWILAIRPLVQSSGMTFLSQMFLNRSVRTMTVVLRSSFSISAWIESMPSAFPFFVALIALLTSVSECWNSLYQSSQSFFSASCVSA